MKSTWLFIFLFTLGSQFAKASATIANIAEDPAWQSRIKDAAVDGLRQRNGWQKNFSANHGKTSVPFSADNDERFLFWPFFGSIVTLGILSQILLFTQASQNAKRWALRGAFFIWLVGLGIVIYAVVNGRL